MKLPRRRFLQAAVAAATLPAMSPIAWAQTYPSGRRASSLATPRWRMDIFDAGRAVLSERLGHQFVVENRPGAGTNIRTRDGVRAAPDGYTLSSSCCERNHATLYEKLNYNFCATSPGCRPDSGSLWSW